MAQKLTLANLPKLAETVARPSYGRADLSAGILHIGVGNFHRAHQAVYLDRLFDMGESRDWAIVGAGVKHFDQATRDRLEGQDWLSTIVELDPDQLGARVNGAMIDFLPVDPAAIVAKLADPAIRIVSLTVTEGGYYVDALTGGFDTRHPEVQADAGAPASPKTVFGMIIAGLRARRDAGQVPFTVMSCDNLPENGHVARNSVLGMARLVDADLADWIADNVAFPNGMVDCITPATTDRERALVRDRFGIEDAAPVICEPFHQWVLEDHFTAGRPALEKVGVEFVDNVTPYELMKLRILNGGHAAIAYVGALLGHTYSYEAMNDPDIAAWYAHLGRTEIIPTLDPIAGVDFDAYLTTCIARFGNTAVADTVARLCLDGSNRQPKFILPTLRDALAQKGAIDGLALEIALWCRFCAATADAGSELALEDERARALSKAALATRDTPDAFLGITDVFGDLQRNARLCAAFSDWMQMLWAHDPRTVLRAYVAGPEAMRKLA
ncbi:mannitol dehydrogenase family protein [Octadecabacter sp. R77987]|uniref:mannitol dehydrogenase family protein n=1 Tax=Octadecabacter sp. R77987 TaxID=3093874 RepID=UPI00366CDE78